MVATLVSAIRLARATAGTGLSEKIMESTQAFMRRCRG